MPDSGNVTSITFASNKYSGLGISPYSGDIYREALFELESCARIKSGFQIRDLNNSERLPFGKNGPLELRRKQPPELYLDQKSRRHTGHHGTVAEPKPMTGTVSQRHITVN